MVVTVASVGGVRLTNDVTMGTGGTPGTGQGQGAAGTSGLMALITAQWNLSPVRPAAAAVVTSVEIMSTKSFHSAQRMPLTSAYYHFHTQESIKTLFKTAFTHASK